ncbi:MAG: hypothetical protein R3B84_14540 [Zavarzinella sp.]
MSNDATTQERKAVSTTLEVENYIDIYQIIAGWIRFADAKAAAVLTVSGALAGLLIPSLNGYLKSVADPKPVQFYVAIFCFFAWLLVMLYSSILAFLCIIPFRRKGVHPALSHCKHFHPASISVHYPLDDPEKFANACDQLTMQELKFEVTSGILVDSHISSAKYQRVTKSIKVLGLSSVLALVYLVLIQF